MILLHKWLIKYIQFRLSDLSISMINYRRSIHINGSIKSLYDICRCSLEFGFFRIDVSDNRKLLERAVFYLDGIIARKVYELEEARAKEEHELLSALGDDPEALKYSTTIRADTYQKYLKMQEDSISPVIYLLLGHYQLLLNLYDDALSAYLKYESLVNEAGRRNLSFLYGFALCSFHFGAFNR